MILRRALATLLFSTALAASALAQSGGPTSGSGTVSNCSTAGAIAYYAATGTTVGCATTGTGVLTALGNATNGAGGLVTFGGNIGAATGTSLALGGASIGSNALAATGFSVDSSGDILSAGNITAGNNSQIAFNGRAHLTSYTDGVIQIANSTAGNNMYLNMIGNSSMQFGPLDGASNPPAAQTLGVENAAGSNGNGSTWTFNGSRPTGSGTGGDILFQTAGTGAGASVKNTLIPALTIKGQTQNVLFAAQAVLQGYTVNTLPAGVTGGSAYVTDAVACTFLATLTGGGSTYCPVSFNGSAWVGG